MTAEPIRAAGAGTSWRSASSPRRSSSWASGSSTRRSTPFVRSFYDRSGDSFVGFDNYVTLFTTDVLLTAIKNNAIWVLVVPALVTAIGLVFAVLTERIRWSVAFKTAVFMPMAISLFAAGVIWRIMYEQDPDQGAVNAAIAVVHDA